MIKINLSRILGEKRMPQSELAELTGIRPTTISEWYNEVVVRINLEHLDKICEALDVNITDLIEYTPNEIPKTGKYLIKEEHGNQKPMKKTKEKKES